jgi:uncharacterized protein YqkB
MKTKALLVLAGLLMARAHAQNVLFDFDTAPLYTPFPLDLTIGGLTAHFSATGQGYSIQSTTTAPVVPVGFSGRFIYPSSVFAADLLVTFSKPLVAFSILYAPQELACDDSATLRVTAYMNATPVGTITTNATALCVCTWQAQTLSITTTQSFNNVVVHYDARPPTCQDWGPIFLADNMTVTLAPPPIILTTSVKSASGPFQFSFTNTPNAPFTVFGTTNPTLPFSNWTALPGLTEAPPGQFQFTDSQATNIPRRFYRVSSP